MQQRLEVGPDGQFLVDAVGWDQFATVLQLRPLAAAPTDRIGRLVRVSYGGLLFERAAVHVLEH